MLVAYLTSFLNQNIQMRYTQANSIFIGDFYQASAALIATAMYIYSLTYLVLYYAVIYTSARICNFTYQSAVSSFQLVHTTFSIRATCVIMGKHHFGQIYTHTKFSLHPQLGAPSYFYCTTYILNRRLFLSSLYLH